jgi:hypothetical protein
LLLNNKNIQSKDSSDRILTFNTISNGKTVNMQKKIDLRNSVTECAQSVKKENAGKFYNYGIKDCMKSIAAQKG